LVDSKLLALLQEHQDVFLQLCCLAYKLTPYTSVGTSKLRGMSTNHSRFRGSQSLLDFHLCPCCERVAAEATVCCRPAPVFRDLPKTDLHPEVRINHDSFPTIMKTIMIALNLET